METEQLHKVLVALGSNNNQADNLSKARECLGRLFAEIRYTEELWTEPYSSERLPAPRRATPQRLYLNQLAEVVTPLEAEEINKKLKEIEQALGRTPEMRQRGIVPIDLDLLLYDSRRYHERDWQRPYVRQLMELL